MSSKNNRKPAAERGPSASRADIEAVERVARLAGGAPATRKHQDAALHARLGYLAKVGNFLLPKAFLLNNQGVLFTGDGPYEAHQLARLLPDESRALVDGEAPEDNSSHVVVVGRRNYHPDRMRRTIHRAHGPPRFVPQEGFIDELLFGRNWWRQEVELLNAALAHHPGLKHAKQLLDGAARRYARPDARFRWPSTEPQDSNNPVPRDADARYRERSPLYVLGYRITDMSREERWEVLTNDALSELGLREVAEIIARLCRERKRHDDGRQRYAYAIAEWEHDLARLKREYYDHASEPFRWPSTQA